MQQVAGPCPGFPQQAHAFVAVAVHYVGLAVVATGITIIARSSTGFERTRRAIECDEVIRMPNPRVEPLLSVLLAIAVAIFCIYLAVL